MPDNKTLTAIVASDAHATRADIEENLLRAGYRVTIAKSLAEMLSYMEQREYGVYLMDLTLGRPDTSDIAPAVQVYTLVKQRAEQGKAAFAGFSRIREALEESLERKIPRYNTDAFTKIEFFPDTLEEVTKYLK